MFFPSEHVVVTSTGTTTQGSKVSAFFLVLLLIIIVRLGKRRMVRLPAATTDRLNCLES